MSDKQEQEPKNKRKKKKRRVIDEGDDTIADRVLDFYMGYHF